MDVLMIIKPEELAGIAEAARLWFKEKNEIFHTFTVEEKKATELRNKIWEVEWDEDARIFIDEIPF